VSAGAWVFLSHSNRDFDGVVKVRNELERLGHRPLMFFLKCIDDSSELNDLIAREIAARDWFVLCDSENAKQSTYVQMERDEIRKYPDKVSVAIDLAADEQSQFETLKGLSDRATVFLSYAVADRVAADEIARIFAWHDYSVWQHEKELSPATSWQDSIANAIDEAISRGWVLVLVTERSLNSQYMKSEVHYALTRQAKDRGGRIIPVVLGGDAAAFSELFVELRGIQWARIRPDSLVQDTEALIRDLKHREMA
jgi:hypothetical protein